MMTRKQFLKTATGLVATATLVPVASVVNGCAPSSYTIHAQVRDNTVIIPLNSIPDPEERDSYTRVYIQQFTNPIILFHREDGELIAVLSTCSHNGCEVKKLRRKFECPCHGSEYNLEGHVIRGPAPEPLERFEVRVMSDRLEIILEGPP